MATQLLCIIRELVLLVILLHIVLGVELRSLPLFEHFEVLSRVLDDVGGLVAEDLAGEVGKDLLET